MSQFNRLGRQGFLTLRIAEPLHESLKDTAERSGQTVSEIARAILVGAMTDEIVAQQVTPK